jgi:hypothetical protein
VDVSSFLTSFSAARGWRAAAAASSGFGIVAMTMPFVGAAWFTVSDVVGTRRSTTAARGWRPFAAIAEAGVAGAKILFCDIADRWEVSKICFIDFVDIFPERPAWAEAFLVRVVPLALDLGGFGVASVPREPIWGSGVGVESVSRCRRVGRWPAIGFIAGFIDSADAPVEGLFFIPLFKVSITTRAESAEEALIWFC